MTTIGQKVAYVKSQGQTRMHGCHWPGCTKQVPPAMFACRYHWYELPADIRADIWEAYRPRQEVTMTPSRAYVEAARRAEQWILENRAAEEPLAPSQASRAIDNRTRDLFE